MRVLVACERSGVVRNAFRALGHEAISCDLVSADDGSDWHCKYDAKKLAMLADWDLVIAHPPCTFLANSGVRWLHERPERWQSMVEAANFFKSFLDAAKHVCIENPIPHGYAVAAIGRKYDQIIQPWQFGHPESKATCLWLKNLPPLQHTNVLEKQGPWQNQTPSGQNKLGPSKDRARLRSQTYPGIAQAMAEQWSAYLKRPRT